MGIGHQARWCQAALLTRIQHVDVGLCLQEKPVQLGVGEKKERN